MSRAPHETVKDLLARGRLDMPQLEEYLAAHPQERARCEEELALNGLLRELPEAPLSTNFTTLAVQAAQAWDKANGPRSAQKSWMARVRSWVPRLAAVSAVFAAALVLYQQHQLAERKELARDLAEAARLANGTPLEVLENFEAIRHLDLVPHDSDRELIAALQ